MIVAGRCLSASHEALAAVRVTPVVMALGQAAGTAAALTAKTGAAVQDIDITALRETLVKNGAFLEPYRPPLISNVID
jgi:hypothetical protein